MEFSGLYRVEYDLYIANSFYEVLAQKRSNSSTIYDLPAFLLILVQGLSPILQFAAIKTSTAG
jgi:hypothetical protein